MSFRKPCHMPFRKLIPPFTPHRLTRTANVNKPNRFCYYVQKFHGFRENLVSVNDSFPISYFYVC